jgi:hypothetical protein
MKTLILTSLIFATSFLPPAQAQGVSTMPALPNINYAELKQYLGLSDAQMTSLQAIQNTRNQSQQAIYQQINDKNQQIYQLLDSGTGTATQIGQLMLDIRTLEKQLTTIDGPLRTQALAVLTADQKTKLAKLAEAMQLQTPAWQAVNLLLIESPYPIGLPIPVDAGGGIATGAAGIGVSSSARPMTIRR